MKENGHIDPALFADDPDWASCVPEIMSGGKKCGLPDHADCAPLDVESVARHLMPGGTLGAISTSQVPFLTADIGLAQLAMHSPYESAGSRDPEYMAAVSKVFYEF